MSIQSIQIPDDDDSKVLHQRMREQGYVVLPFNQEQFKEFITSLLGSPQSITKQTSGSFTIDFDDINNLHHLLMQRITQQNNGMLVRFGAVIVFSDNSTVEINSLPELLTYNEIRPIVSNDIHLTWDFLIHFPDKRIPEKQQIQISILTYYENKSQKMLDNLKIKWAGYGAGAITFRIEYTARSWGADIEALLTNHVKSLLVEPSKFKKFFYDNDNAVGIVSMLIFWGFFLVGAFSSIKNFSQQQILLINKLLTSNALAAEDINSKLNRLLSIIAEGSWEQYLFKVFSFLFIGIIGGVFLGSLISGFSVDVGVIPSFLLLSKESKKNRDERLKGLKKSVWYFILSLIFNVALGVASSYIFVWLTSK